MANGVTNKDLYDELNSFRREMRETYVSKDDFAPVKKAVYGTVGLILIAFVLALIALAYPHINSPEPQSGSQALNTPSSSNTSANTPQSSKPSATASATSHSDSTQPDSSSSGGLLDGVLKTLTD